MHTASVINELRAIIVIEKVRDAHTYTYTYTYAHTKAQASAGVRSVAVPICHVGENRALAFRSRQRLTRSLRCMELEQREVNSNATMRVGGYLILWWLVTPHYGRQ